ncbi:alpha/beta fold hydrolase [Sphingomonas bacterium]|uniref:alpha/beta fold hydrolase n=1 Tax=Sphingomonas bacterium TaxID=1895847 RepID=UPI001575AA1B|nr:alpha/beta fold hydrolase [Sphingomonas bacterium]
MTSLDDIYLTRWGHAGPTVVLVHGSAQGSRVGGDRHFAAQQVLASEGWQLVVPDRPGHGRSPAPGRPDDAEADGAWVADLLGDDLPGGGAHLVGHSFGGCVALAAAARRPGAVRSLTLIEPGMQKLAIDDPRVRRFVLKLAGTMIFSFTAKRRAAGMARLLGIPGDIRGGSNPEELKAMGRGIAKLKVPAAATLQRELETVKRAGIPLLVVTGGWSPAFDVVGERVAAIGGGRHEIVASPNHFPNLMPAFNPMLTAFMRAADARA